MHPPFDEQRDTTRLTFPRRPVVHDDSLDPGSTIKRVQRRPCWLIREVKCIDATSAKQLHECAQHTHGTRYGEIIDEQCVGIVLSRVFIGSVTDEDPMALLLQVAADAT